MSTIFDDDILIHYIATPGLPGDGFTAVEAAQVRSDLDTMLARPTIDDLNDIPDVDTTGVADGNALVWNALSATWSVGESGHAIAGQPDNGAASSPAVADIQKIVPGLGLRGRASNINPLTDYVIEAVFGTSANTLAEGSHAHTNPVPVFERFNATGYLSGGSREVVSRSVTLAAGIQYVVVARFRPQIRGADEGTSYYRLRVEINGNPRVSDGGASSGFWCVQGVPKKEDWVHAISILGTGVAITVTGTVQYHDGVGMYVDAGDLEIDLRTNK